MMPKKHIMVRYRVKAGSAAENEQLIAAVFAQLRETLPADLTYSAHKLDDGVSFVHLAEIRSTDGSNPLTGLSAFQAFTRNLRDRCEEPPVSVELQQVGAYSAPEH